MTQRTDIKTRVISGAILSDDGVYRYALWRTWDPSKPPAVFVMLNPSTADAAADDPTIRKCVGFARRWECGAIYVVNLFAYRSTDPRNLRGVDVDVLTGPTNDHHIRRAMAGSFGMTGDPLGGPVVAAWGSQPKAVLGTQPAALAGMAAGVGVKLQCMGRTYNGSPRHPLMLAYSTPLEPFDG